MKGWSIYPAFLMSQVLMSQSMTICWEIHDEENFVSIAFIDKSS